MTERSGRAAIRMAGLAAVIAAAASGCVSLQANGPVTSVAEGDAGSSQVQIWPSPPTPSETSTAIVTGFLQAARSGAANLAIADDYLTADMQKQWQAEQNSVIVLADDSETVPQPAGQDAAAQGDSSSTQLPEADSRQNRVAQDVGGASGSVTEQVQGNLLGTVDSSGVYSASTGTATYDFGVTETKQGFRISSLPADFGVLMERTDFEASYDRHDVYYENARYGPGKLIPTQIYLPAIDTDQDIANAMAKVVVQGVPDQLGAALQDSVQGAQLKGGVQFQNNDSANVTIDSYGTCAKDAAACRNLGQQLAATLNSLSTKVTTVNVVDQANGKSYPADTPDPSLTSYGLSQGAHSGQPFYGIGNDGALERVDTFSTVHASELGFGQLKTKFKQVAVGPTRQADRPDQIALVSQDGTKVYVQRRQGGAYGLSQIYPASSGQAAGPAGTVGTLSWDAEGVLWFTVTRSGVTDVYRYGANSLSLVTVDALPGQITQIAAAPDGSRVAVAYKDSNGDAWIAIAAAVSDPDGNWLLEMGVRETVAGDWSQVRDFDWYNEDSLAVLGIQPNSQVLGLYQLYADGSSVYDSLTDQPVQAVPPANAQSFVWSSGGQPIAAVTALDGKNSLYTLSVEGQDAQLLSGVSGISPSY